MTPDAFRTTDPCPPPKPYKELSVKKPARSLASFLPLVALGLLSCGEPPEMPGKWLMPHLYPIVYFGNLQERPDGMEADLTDESYEPFRWTLQLQSVGTEPVTITDWCAYGAEGQFDLELEPGASLTIEPGGQLLARITYQRSSAREQPDHVTFIFQSDAVDESFPTLDVTACGRVIPEGATPEAFDCEPQVVPAQQPDRDLCN